MRIVSLLPSATEILCELGLEDHLVGVTHECDYPPWVRSLPRVTRTLIPHNATSAEIDAMVRERLKTQKALYTLDMDTLVRLRPDLIVTQALCDVCAVAEAEVAEAACHLPGAPRVINLEPMSLEDVFHTLLLVGRATGREAEACRAVERMQARVTAVMERTGRIPLSERPRVVFLEWIDPPFPAGHWTPSLVERAGGINVLGCPGAPSRTTPWHHVRQAQPEVLFVACCGFTTERALQDLPILQAQEGWEELPCVRNHRVYFTDGHAYFNRPGPRLVDSLEILAHALHPAVHPLPPHLTAAVCAPVA
ncbi:MAG: cobalamin-binding protein [Chloroherpetonaceae bacterium]|nr:cobalamin-binding protein [Chthonomonadaceae bacterium]MDW8207643.1 cobalamin-binding protein [Chloroherpetonaceae bacterium]